MSEQSIQLRSQVSLGNTSVDSSGNPIVPYGLTQAKQHAKTKPRFAEFACTYVEVRFYVMLHPHFCTHAFIGLSICSPCHQVGDSEGLLGLRQ